MEHLLGKADALRQHVTSFVKLHGKIYLQTLKTSSTIPLSQQSRRLCSSSYLTFTGSHFLQGTAHLVSLHILRLIIYLSLGTYQKYKCVNNEPMAFQVQSH